MSTASPNDDQQRLEEIVAYLDGELSSAENAAVERQLARDESFRQQMQRIERAWNALDELPRTTLDDRFSRTTMELVVGEAAAEVDAKTQALPTVRRKRRWTTALAAVAAALLAFLVVRIVRDAPNRALIADLPVVSNVDRYLQFQSVDFLRQLDQRYGTQLRAATLSGADVQDEVAEATALARTDARRDWLAQLADEQRTVLRGQYDRFQALSDAEQQRMRQLHRQLTADDAAMDQLFETLIVYRRWVAQWPASRQFELRSMTAEERLAEIGSALRRGIANEALHLSDKQLRTLLDAIRNALPEGRGGREGDDRMPMRLQRMLAGGRPPGSGAAWDERNERLDAIRNALPEKTREAFDELPPAQKLQQIRQWAAQAMSLQGKISRQELEEFFVNDLDEATRAELLTLPPEEMESRLRRLYLGVPERRGGGPGRGWGGGPGRQPRGRGPYDGRPPRPREPGFGGPGRGGFGEPPPWGGGLGPGRGRGPGDSPRNAGPPRDPPPVPDE